MDRNDSQAIDKLVENEKRIKHILKSREDLSTKRYADLHSYILECAKELHITGNSVYKLLPLINIHDEDHFKVDNNRIELSIRDNMVIFDGDMKNIEIHDRLYIENDHLFEKRNIPLILKTFAKQKDRDSLILLEEYIKGLIQIAENAIQDEDIL